MADPDPAIERLRQALSDAAYYGHWKPKQSDVAVLLDRLQAQTVELVDEKASNRQLRAMLDSLALRLQAEQ